jgi:hypothetical protein
MTCCIAAVQWKPKPVQSLYLSLLRKAIGLGQVAFYLRFEFLSVAKGQAPFWCGKAIGLQPKAIGADNQRQNDATRNAPRREPRLLDPRGYRNMSTPARAPAHAVVWQPQPGPQAALLACPVFEVFFGGARGGGKTDGMLGEWASHADLYGAHAIGLMVRRERTQLVEAIERSRALFAPLGAKFNEHDWMWRFPGGARLRFAYLEHDSDAGAARCRPAEDVPRRRRPRGRRGALAPHISRPWLPRREVAKKPDRLVYEAQPDGRAA